MACFGAFCFLLFFWYLDAICRATLMALVNATCSIDYKTYLLVSELLHEVILWRNEVQQCLESLIVLLERRLQLVCRGRHLSFVAAKILD